jgi:hypothetical protein
MIDGETDLIGLALALGAADMPNWSDAEKKAAVRAAPIPATTVRLCRAAIGSGEDPLGEAFCRLRSPAERRPLGATYTPQPIVSAMLDWSAGQDIPVRVVDPGSGSGRFIVAAGRKFPRAHLIATEIDPVAALLLRAHLVCAGLASRATVVVGDYREMRLPELPGRTLFVGNPPYVRHHLIESTWKKWLTEQARSLGLESSQLAGLHVHFFLATALHGRPGDYGTFITAAEWLDVNYGALVRQLFMGSFGGKSILLIEPTALPFADADTTAVITCFEIGNRAATVRLRRVDSLEALAPLDGGKLVRRERLDTAPRWTPLMTRHTRKAPDGFVELGELCHVHRGQVTGANKIWIAGEHSMGLPESVLFPSVTKARELFAAGAALTDSAPLRRVIDIPVEYESLPQEQCKAVKRFLGVARKMGADRGFIATHRKAWWSVGLRHPAPILATYMARRPPAFVLNLARARHINIAHGLYPRDALRPDVLDALAQYLSSATSLKDGRTYAGGLTKFEPKEMERLWVPGPDLLASHATGACERMSSPAK